MQRALSRRFTNVVIGTAALAALVFSCERRPSVRTSVNPPVVGTTETTSAELGVAEPRTTAPFAAEHPPAGLVPVGVPGEPTSFVIGAKAGVPPRIVYLHGMCSGPADTLATFERAASEHGGVLGLTGDRPCGDQHSFTVEPGRQQKRIAEAVASIAGSADAPLPEVVIGYSLGASVAERLAAAYGYPFVVLIGAPREPSADNLANARAVVMISGEKDMARPKMKAARAACEAAGIPAHYIEMPGARHGELPDGDAVIDEALGWMRANARRAGP